MNKLQRNDRNVSWWIILLLAVTTFGLGILIGKTIDEDPVPETANARHMGRTTFTNPLIDHGGVNESNKAYAPLRKQIELESKKFLSNESVYALSVYFQDLETGKWFGINERERYAPASLMKVTLLVVYLKLAENNPSFLDEIIVNDGSYTELANVPPAQRLALNREYTVSELLYNMIVHSNNEAQHLLSDHLDKRVTPETQSRLVHETMTLIPASYDLGDNYDLTVVDYAGIFRILYNATYLSEQMSERALALLAESSFDSGIVNGIPADIVTANKFGFKQDSSLVDDLQFHDCGIVYAEPSPYILCIMTKTDDPVAAQESVSTISRIVYEAVAQQ